MVKKLIKIIVFAVLAAAVFIFGLNAYITLSVREKIVFTCDGSSINDEELRASTAIDPQCILVLGCAVWENNQPSPMLKDRLDTAIELYNKGAAPKLLLSGDNSSVYYSEPDCMLQYALEQGVPEEDIFLDLAGFSTYDSVYRAKEVFCADRMIVVTQKYHLYRALKICEALGVQAVGAAADPRSYTGKYFRELREVLARDKDFLKCIFRPEPKFLGDKIPIDGDGRVTHVN